MSDDQRTLLLSAREGDHRAFAALRAGCERRILSLALDITGNTEDAPDIYQETLIAAYRALPTFRMDSRFCTWLYRIALNQALRFRSRWQRRLPSGGVVARARRPSHPRATGPARGVPQPNPPSLRRALSPGAPGFWPVPPPGLQNRGGRRTDGVLHRVSEELPFLRPGKTSAPGSWIYGEMRPR
ncbi:MAG: hypothetical protein FJY95_10770 [Candidatus Handelsmanbacteria bacterium]|nr:hypothetical protein [Candidatus Handelsmanbacteria bacterium]